MEFERGHHVRYIRPSAHLVKYAGTVVETRGIELGSYGIVNGVGQVRLSPDGFLRYYPVVYVSVARLDGDVSTYVFWADELQPIRADYIVERTRCAAEELVEWVVRDTPIQWVIRDTRSQALVRERDLLISPPLRWDSYNDAQQTADHWNWCGRHLAPKTEFDLKIRMCSQRSNRVCLLCAQEFEA